MGHCDDGANRGCDALASISLVAVFYIGSIHVKSFMMVLGVVFNFNGYGIDGDHASMMRTMTDE